MVHILLIHEHLINDLFPILLVGLTLSVANTLVIWKTEMILHYTSPKNCIS